LASEEGIFCEPASAASVAGLLKVKDKIPTTVFGVYWQWPQRPRTAITHNQSFFKQGSRACDRGSG